jgi:hypothetical protein
MNVFGPSSLQKFLKSIVLAPTIEDERVLITEELASMRTLVRECSDRHRPRIIAKLLYLGTIGCDTAWGQMEAVGLMAHERPSYKRIGYLTVAQMLDETNERIVLITSTVQKDLQNPDPVVQRLALTLVANLCSTEMAQSVVSDVVRLHTSTDFAVRKCVGLASLRILRKCPELIDEIRPIVAPFLNHKWHCIVAAGFLLAAEMLRIDASLVEEWSGFAYSFTKMLRSLNDARMTDEFHFGAYSDHFLEIRLLEVLCLLKSPSDELDEVLSAMATGAETQKNSGRSVLLAAVHAIGQTANKPSLRSLAFNQVGRLLSSPEANMLYSSLSMFSGVLYSGSAILDRSSSDSQVLQRYKSQVVKCLDHPDPSVRRRALDVIAALVDETNIESLIPEIMNYLRLADRDFRTELVAKVFASVQRFAPSVQWSFDTTVKLLTNSGNYVGNDVITACCRLVGRHPELREYMMGELYAALRTEVDMQPLIQVAAWALGEFQESVSDVSEVIGRLLSMPQTMPETKGYLLTALAKLAVRFGHVDAIRPTLTQFAGSNHLEIQQRAGELLRVIDKTGLCDQILAPIELEEEPVAAAGQMRTDPSIDLLDVPIEQKPQLLAHVARAPSAATPPAAKELDAPPGAVEALRTPDYVVYFEVQKNAQNPRQIAIRSTVFGLGALPLTRFVIQYGVPPGWGIRVQPPSGNVLEPKGGKPIRHVFLLENRGGSPLVMLTQTSYMYGAQPIKETGKVNPIFD